MLQWYHLTTKIKKKNLRNVLSELFVLKTCNPPMWRDTVSLSHCFRVKQLSFIIHIRYEYNSYVLPRPISEQVR